MSIVHQSTCRNQASRGSSHYRLLQASRVGPTADPHTPPSQRAKEWLRLDDALGWQHAARRDGSADDHLSDDRRRRAGVDIHADLPLGKTRNMAVEDVLDCAAIATASEGHAEHFVLLRVRPRSWRPK